ncbi:MAG: hypothetical protein WDW38_000650 [Sanguina aurantia]
MHMISRTTSAACKVQSSIQAVLKATTAAAGSSSGSSSSSGTVSSGNGDDTDHRKVDSMRVDADSSTALKHGTGSKAIETARAALLQHTGMGIPHIIHQVHGLYHDGPPRQLTSMMSFKQLNPEYIHIMWGEADVNEFVDSYFPALATTFRHLHLPVLKADLVRYLLVFTFGGVYSDMDTVCLKPIREWSSGQKDVSLIVGVEADTKGIPDWAKSYGRELQMVQWTFAAAPGHPVLANTFFRISKLLSHMDPANISVNQVTATTGPSVWTDAVYDHIAAQGLDWRSLMGMRSATQIGDMYLLTITGFSPGVGHMGAGTEHHPDARVMHSFQGSWTKQKPAM